MTNHSSTASPYQSGFGNEFCSEARPGALPLGRNSPQKAPFGLYAELLSGTAFTAPRAHNRRTWMYRLRPSAMHSKAREVDVPRWQTGPFVDCATPANRMRWNPWAGPQGGADFIDGMFTIGGNGDAHAQTGVAVHLYHADRSMGSRYLMNSDGEVLVLPQQGTLRIDTELGQLTVVPGEFAVVPRGMRWRVDVPDGLARGYVCENYGSAFRLPELGPIGSNGLANARDFLAPVARFEETTGGCTVVNKYLGHFWESQQDHSPLDVVAWHGNLVPYKYDMANFMAIGTVSFDHPDPSINTVLTSNTDTPGVANCDFVIFPPRWLVAEDTFRPPWFHRNIMSELMGLVRGVYDAKAEGFVPGGVSLHNSMLPHGPDAATFEKASAAALAPHRLEDTLAFMFESRHIFRPTRQALTASHMQPDYDEVWSGFTGAALKPTGNQ